MIRLDRLRLMKLNHIQQFFSVSSLRHTRSRSMVPLLLMVSVLFFTSCGGESLTDNYKVGGLVTGLAGSGLVLSLNDGEQLTISSNGPFVFETGVWKGGSYTVAVVTQPSNPEQTCLLANETGISRDDIQNVEVVCDFLFYSIGGSASGLSGGMTLQNNGGDDLVVNGDGPFSFSTKLAHGTTYLVSVSTPPTGQACSVAAGSGVALMDVADVSVVCSSTGFLVGGTVTGLKSVLYLQNNYEILPIRADGNFQFVQSVPANGQYDVKIYRQPVDQACSVTFGFGAISSDVSIIEILCRTRPRVE